MRIKQRNTSAATLLLRFRIFFRRFPALPYLLKWSLISICIGAFIGTASAGFLQSLDWATRYREAHVWIVLLLPVAGFLIGLLYYYWGKNVEGGNNLLIDTLHEPKGIIPFRMSPFVYVGTIATHLFGGSAGREGTALQMAGAIADPFSLLFRLTQNERKMLLVAAIAAGFGSVFGTPLAGAIFGLEVYLVGGLHYKAVFPAFLSAIIADLVTRLWHTQHTQYHIGVVPDLSILPLLYAVVAGTLFGGCAALFSKALHSLASLFKSTIPFPPLRPVVGGVIVALSVWAIGTTQYIGLGIPAIVASFQHPLSPYDFAVKMAFTIVTLGAGFKGGEVTPLFFIGAALGNALSLFIPLPTGLLAGMGFAAVFAGAANTPLACSVMAMELFGSECGVYVAIACVVAYLFSGHNSIYSRQMIGTAKHNRFAHYEGKRFEDL